MSKEYVSDYDAIVIGSGIAGMFTALQIDSRKKVLLISKERIEISNTDLAQGGIAVTFNPSDYESHFTDTLKTGNFYNNKESLQIMIEEGAENINTLIEWGVNFDTDENGQILFTREGGHTKRRIIHHKDTTGQEIVRGMHDYILKQKNITISEDIFAKDLIVEANQVLGIEVIKKGDFIDIYCSNIVIATGGIGELYENTTNAKIATGDGIAFAYRAGTEVKDMEFVQFHPTALNVPGHSHFLISEAVRGEGGILKNEKNEAFMEKYHELKDLAPRTIVSRAILEECQKQSNDKVYVDVTHLDKDFITNRFPNIYSECLKRGIDITNQLIPIVPVQHYIMGGIKTDNNGKTNIKGLYACGEVACTGVHGANRMASNSLLEAIVFANRVANEINIDDSYVNYNDFDLSSRNSLNSNKGTALEDDFINEKRKQLLQIMSRDVFVFRNHENLVKALEEVRQLANELPEEFLNLKEFELYNMITVALIIIEASINRKESLGSHMIDGGK